MSQVANAAPAAPARRMPGKFDLFLAIGATVVLLVSVFYAPDEPPGLSVCTFYTATGLPCPGCGLTRAFCCISHLRWGDAWSFNPFGFAWYAATLFLVIRPVLLRRENYPERERNAMASRWGYVVPIVFVLAMWVFGLIRMWDAAKHRHAPAAVNSQTAEPPSPSDPPASPVPAPDGAAGLSTDSRA